MTDLLDANAILAAVPWAARAYLDEVRLFTELASTNSYLLQEARLQRVACLAEFQTAGRGRQGKPWLSPVASGLCLSLAWPGLCPVPAGLSLALGIGLVRVLESLGATDLGLKWPNDVVWGPQRHKLAGLLLETRLQGEQGRLVVGLGLNVRLPVTALQVAPHEQPRSDLQHILPKLPSRSHLAGLILGSFLTILADYAQRGFAPFLADWQRLDCLQGQALRVYGGNLELDGVAQGIDAEGALLVLTSAGVQRLHGGDISVRTRL